MPNLALLADNPYLAGAFGPTPEQRRASLFSTIANTPTGLGAGIAAGGASGQPWFAGIAPGLATENILGALISPRFADAPVLHPIRKALGLVDGGANEATLNRLYEVIADPTLTAALTKKATPGNVKMAEPVLQSIARSAALPAARESQ